MAEDNERKSDSKVTAPTVAQPPNKSLIVFVLAWLVSIVIEDGAIQNGAYTVFVISGVIWSYQEITAGINWFRRLLGLIILAGIAASLYRELFF